MLQKKVCMLGSFSVGKSSLLRRFVENMFDDQYHTTIGVKVDKKVMNVSGEDLTLVLWDIYGEDAFRKCACPICAECTAIFSWWTARAAKLWKMRWL